MNTPTGAPMGVPPEGVPPRGVPAVSPPPRGAQPLGMPPPNRPRPRLRRFLSYVWSFLPLFSIGMLSPIPILYAAFKLRSWAHGVAGALYLAALVTVFAADSSAELPDWAGGIILGLMIVPTAHALAVRRRVFEPRRLDPVIAAALNARQRREEARELAARDPNLAREVRIGRPDLPRQFDDGGLVDVNHVPGGILVQQLGLSEADASRILEARDRLGGFSSPEEVIAFTDLSPALVDGIRDRLVFLR